MWAARDVGDMLRGVFFALACTIFARTFAECECLRADDFLCDWCLCDFLTASSSLELLDSLCCFLIFRCFCFRLVSSDELELDESLDDDDEGLATFLTFFLLSMLRKKQN